MFEFQQFLLSTMHNKPSVTSPIIEKIETLIELMEGKTNRDKQLTLLQLLLEIEIEQTKEEFMTELTKMSEELNAYEI